MKLNEGIVVKTIKYQENSKLITILTDNNLSTYLVTGGANYKNHNFSYTNELTKIGFDYKEKAPDSLKILTTGMIIDNYSNIKQSYEKLSDAIIILELINQLGDHFTDFSTLYTFVNDILQIIDHQSYSSYYLIIFRLKLLYLLGVGPVFTKCVNCESKENLKGFVFMHGGMCCENCATSATKFYPNAIIEIIKILYLTKLDKITPEFLAILPDYRLEISNFLNLYYEQFLGYHSRAAKIIEKLK